MRTYHVTINVDVDAKTPEKLVKVLNRMLEAGGDAVTLWEPIVKEATDE